MSNNTSINQCISCISETTRKSTVLMTLLFLVSMIASDRSANATASESLNTVLVERMQGTTRSETEMVVRAAVAENALITTKDINSLTVKLNSQEEEIKALRKLIADFEEPGDIYTITIVLTCVSVLITILGVAFAILSIFGYTNIREEAVRSAKTAATETVEKITKEELPTETERNIIELIEKNRFDSIIKDAVENVIYRGISMTDDASDNGDLN